MIDYLILIINIDNINFKKALCPLITNIYFVQVIIKYIIIIYITNI